MDSFLKYLEDNCPGDDAHSGWGDPRPLLERCGECASTYEEHRKALDLETRELREALRVKTATAEGLEKGIEEAGWKLEQSNRQIDGLKNALYAECRGIACDSEGCCVGYRQCSGCEARAKGAFGPGWQEFVYKRSREGDGHVCVAAEFAPCPVCGRKIELSR